MPRLTPVDPAIATGKAKELLDAVKGKIGMVPNMMRTMANSPVVLQTYLSMAGALGQGELGPLIGERIALAVGQENSCDYCVSAHTLLGKKAGLVEGEVMGARRFQSAEPRVTAALKLAKAVVQKRGMVSDAEVAEAKAAGLSDGAIGEVVAMVALNILTNYFNNVAQTEVDFPKVSLAM